MVGVPQPLSTSDLEDATAKLSKSSMFRRCAPDELKGLAKAMQKVAFSRGDLIVAQNQSADRMLVMAHGYARRIRKGRDGVERYLDTTGDGTTISELHVTSGEPVYATAKCVTQNCSAYSMSRAAFRKELERSPQLATQVIESLSEDVWVKSRRFRTPLLAQRTKEINYSAVAVASVVESYFRSALNSVLNQQLSGVSAPLFPNMHVQVPARVLYITGFKSLRALFDKHIDPDQWSTHSARVAVRFSTTIAPGLVMTPISSILEASNAGQSNPEPMLKRATRGFTPRLGREIIFGVGLNQLSDYFEERYRGVTPNFAIASTAGSLSAGVISGYFSHVPHNISTYKLLNPTKSYGELFRMFVDKSVPNLPMLKKIPDSAKPYIRGALACLFPRGVLIRTVQICGSFTILNGLIQLIESDNRRRIGKVLESITEDGVSEEGVTLATPQKE